jgi:hypothetical protein
MESGREDGAVLTIREQLQTNGYALVAGGDLPIDPALRQFEATLAAEWECLEIDKYLRMGARFRERRYDRFRYLPSTGSVTLRPHRPYFQSMEANGYGGGIQREVAPLTTSTLENPLLMSLIGFDFQQFPVAPGRLDQPWDVQCHQFRIVGRAAELGEPTPEGPHRDEVDFGAIHLMSRSNVAGGNSQVFNPDSDELLADFCLENIMDTMYWADSKVLHAVTPISAQDDDQQALRDVLILGYQHAPALDEDDAAWLEKVGSAVS